MWSSANPIGKRLTHGSGRSRAGAAKEVAVRPCCRETTQRPGKVSPRVRTHIQKRTVAARVCSAVPKPATGTPAMC